MIPAIVPDSAASLDLNKLDLFVMYSVGIIQNVNTIR